MLVNTGSTPVLSRPAAHHGGAGWQPDGELVYALEGAVFVTGAAVQWLRDGLQVLIGSAAEVEVARPAASPTAAASSSCRR